jgi:hypothetical protein
MCVKKKKGKQSKTERKKAWAHPPGLTQFQVTKSHYLKVKKLKSPHQIFTCAHEIATRRRWRKNTAGRQHRRQGGPATATQVSDVSTGLPCI